MTPHPALVARRRRIQSIRRRVAAGAATLFIALFSTIYVQMSAGDDPALATQTVQASTTTGSTTSSGSTTTTGSSSSGSSGSTSSGSAGSTSSGSTSSGASSSQGSAPMTTSAS